MSPALAYRSGRYIVNRKYVPLRRVFAQRKKSAQRKSRITVKFRITVNLGAESKGTNNGKSQNNERFSDNGKSRITVNPKISGAKQGLNNPLLLRRILYVRIEDASLSNSENYGQHEIKSTLGRTAFTRTLVLFIYFIFVRFVTLSYKKTHRMLLRGLTLGEYWKTKKRIFRWLNNKKRSASLSLSAVCHGKFQEKF